MHTFYKQCENKDMKPFKRIFIIGHPGAGKAVLAKAISEKLGWQFIDADSGLESKIGCSLYEIIGNEGEKSFQECNYKILSELLKKENIVVATDGSIICSEMNRQILFSEFTVYLKVNTFTQLDRSLRNPEPLLGTDLKTLLDAFHHERDHLYEQVSSISVNGDDNKLNEHVSAVLNNFCAIDSEESPDLLLDKKELVFFHRKNHQPVKLSNQQALCLKLLAQGKTSKDIARIMNISHRTVEKYLARTMEILGCESSKELIALYHDNP